MATLAENLTDAWTTVPGIASILVGVATFLNTVYSKDYNTAASVAQGINWHPLLELFGFISAGFVGLFSNSKIGDGNA